VPSPHPPKGPSSDDLVVAVAHGVQQLVSNGSDPSPGVDLMADTPASANSGFGRSILVSLGYAGWTVAATSVLAAPSDSIPRSSALEIAPYAGSRDSGTPDEAVTIPVSKLPAPSRAGLITAADSRPHGGFDERLTRLFDALGEFQERSAQPVLTYPYFVQAALSVLALEAVRRWRGRSTKKLRHHGRSRFLVSGSIL
jgi:hypothetical protein